MTEYILIYPHDSRAELFLFSRDDPEGRRIVRPRYADLVCARCGKFDEMKALLRGIDADIVITTTRDMIGAIDGQYLVSRRLRDILDKHAASLVQYVDIPASPTYCVALPAYLIYPKEGDSAYRIIGQPCRVCGRRMEVIWGSGVPKIPSGVTIGAFANESRIGMAVVWFVSRELADVLRLTEPKLSGLFFDPKRIPAA